jgi:putative endopeptidase
MLTSERTADSLASPSRERRGRSSRPAAVRTRLATVCLLLWGCCAAGSFPTVAAARERPTAPTGPARTRPELNFDIGAVDPSVDPCDDFYQYACGGWLAQHPVPPDRSAWAIYEEMQEVNQARVVDILEHAARLTGKRTPAERRIGDYYAACLDEVTIEAKGLEPLQSELARIDRIRSVVGLAHELARLHDLGSDALFALYASQRLEDATQVIAYVDQSGLSLPDPEEYSGGGRAAITRSVYRAHLTAVFGLLGEEPAQAASSAEAVVGIETALARASLGPVARRDRSAWYHLMTLQELARLAPAFPWKRYFAARGLGTEVPVNAAVPGYLRTIDGLVRRTPLDAWRRYLRWQLIHVAAPELPRRFRLAEFGFYGRSLSGVKQPPPRATQCADLTNRDLGEAVGRAYVSRFFTSVTKQKVADLVDQLRRAMREDFGETTWWNPNTRWAALAKLEKLRAMIGYPDRWRDYAGLKIARGDALGNAFRAQQFEAARQVAKVGRPVDRGEFYELPQAAEGYHDNSLNVIVFTAGILQPPFFDPKIDKAVTFGLTGGVIGHEITHAFDDKGHLFDGDGNLKDWWAPEDSRRYGERAACFVRQYSDYTAVDDLRVDGELTLGENIADNGGLQLAYRAFAEEYPQPGPAIDGFTPQQRFFLGWAQWRCANVTSQTAAIRARTDPHSPSRWRVNGVVSNMPAFARAYGCRPAALMVNQTPCRIW